MNVLKVYFLLLGFVSAFSLTDITPLPMIVAFIVLLTIFISSVREKKVKFYYNAIPAALYFLFFITLILSYMIQIFNIDYTSTGLNHALSYFVVIFLYGAVILYALYKSDMRIERIFKYISYGVIFASFIVITEFVLKNFFAIDIDNYIYRPSAATYSSTYSANGHLFFRARGVAVESGHMAMFLLMFLPFVIYYYKNLVKSIKKTIFTCLIITTSLILTFSAIGILELLIAIAITASIYYIISFLKWRVLIKKRNLMLLLFLMMPSSLLIFLLIFNFDNYLPYIQTVIQKITLTDINSSAASRINRWDDALNFFSEKPFLGSGPGITSIKNDTGSTNLFLEILTQMGVLGLSVFGLIILFYIVIAFKIKSNIKYVYLFSMAIAITHYMAVSNYWFPWLWTLFAIINYTYAIESRSRKEKTTSRYSEVDPLKMKGEKKIG